MAKWLSGVMVLYTLVVGVVSATKTPPQTFQAALDRYVASRDQLVPAWRRLHATRWPDDQSYVYQMLATADAMVGRYAQARQEFEQAFDRPRPKSSGCSSALGEGSFQDWLSSHAARVDLVMVNEAHTEPVTRALVYQMLPLLRRQGYTILAMEALYDSDIARAIDARGYPLDDKAAFYYLREPIEGEVLREAKRLGFRLMSYEQWANVPGAREAGQAANLAAILKKHPGAKVFVVAGHGHVYRQDGRMAQRLAEIYAKPFLSINQLGWQESPATDPCVRAPAGAAADSMASMRWKPGDHGTDITVVRAGTYALERGAAGSDWLTLGGTRSHHRFGTAPCGPHAKACLVEARYADEQAEAVPADRYLAGEGEEHADLYLRDGRYVVSYRDAAGKLKESDNISVAHGVLSTVP
ncbi:hypothetical protein [Frateuria sp. YIM B11624]|uniref:hypothetical protein n=1 Tax=Frateuria sp. YIM B11624 TaxID=3143185 RepID=UPI003C7234E1